MRLLFLQAISQTLHILFSAPTIKFFRHVTVWFCLAGWSFSALGGQYLISTFGADEGMPESSVMGVAQTPDGYLWIGTIMGGVSRFDGLRFVNFVLEGTQGQGPMQVNRLFTDWRAACGFTRFSAYGATTPGGLSRNCPRK